MLRNTSLCLTGVNYAVCLAIFALTSIVVYPPLGTSSSVLRSCIWESQIISQQASVIFLSDFLQGVTGSYLTITHGCTELEGHDWERITHLKCICMSSRSAEKNK